MKKKGVFCILIVLLVLLMGCGSKKNFVGTWKTDLFDQGKTRDTGAKIAGKAAGGGIWDNITSMFADQLHWNATMEIKEDGTLTMDSGMIFNATWKQDGDKITIDGKNIYGTATLSDDQKTLYFKNTLRDATSSNGFAIGSDSVDFEFKKVE